MNTPRGRAGWTALERAVSPTIRQRLPYVGLGGAVALAGLSHVFPHVNALPILALLVLVASVVALRRDVLTLGAIATTAIVIDYYQLVALPKGFPFVALAMMVALIVVLWVERRDERPFLGLPDLPLWAVLLALVALAIPRSVSLKVGLIYFLEVIFAAFCAWVLGTLVIGDGERLRGLLNVLTVLAVLIGVHGTLGGPFRTFLFDTPVHHAYLVQQHFFYVIINNRYYGPGRASSFLLNPDSDGAFLAMMFFLPAGLFFAARSLVGKGLYLGAALIILVSLLYTDTVAAWLALAIALVPLVALAVRPRYAALTLGGAVVVGLLGLLAFRSEAHRLFAHATSADELTLREQIWGTALRIIRAHPLTGIGLGTGEPYNTRAASYLVSVAIRNKSHPHNSFLELAALAGLPVLLAYLAVLVSAAMRAIRNYRLASWTYRPLLAGVFAALLALTIHGLADATWTLPALVPIAWMLVGAVSSPHLTEWLEVTRLSSGSGAATPVRYPVSAGTAEAAQQPGTQEGGQ